MDRQIVYPGAIPLDTDILSIQRNMMTALGFLAQATLGTGTWADGLLCTQTTVASMVVNVGPGSIVALSTVDASAFGSLAADSTDNLVKMGVTLATTPFTLTAPVVAGQSINYLIEASFLESDTNAVVLPYYNASNPAMPYSGPSNSGAAQNTQRIQRAQLQLKAGASATTGTQTTPSVDSGWVGLWVITVNYGMTSVTNSAISVYPGAPFIGAARVPQISMRLPPVSSRSSTGVSLGASYSGSQTVTFTAPCAGYAYANANLNLSTTASAGITATLYINGTSVAHDTTTLSQSQLGVAAVTAGSTVTVTFQVTTTTNPAVAATYMVGAIFVPAP